METVEVIIKLPKFDYEEIKHGWNSNIQTKLGIDAIRNGTVLPKEHGRLLILDEELTKKFFASFSFSCQKWISEVGISNATLKVIEAEKESEG